MGQTEAAFGLDDARDMLSRLNLTMVGQSSRSRSSYWSTEESGQVRLRLSDHAVVYPSSECAVCLGYSQDDDVLLDGQESVVKAVKLLLEKTLQHETRKAYENDCEECAEGEDPRPMAEHRVEQIESMINHARNWRLSYLELLPES